MVQFRYGLLLAAAAAAMVLTCALPRSAQAALGVSAFTAVPTDATAAAHSDFRISIAFSDPADDVKDVVVELPAGLIGNPAAAPRCTANQLQSDTCPANTTVGTTSVDATAAGLPIPITATGTIYNVEPSGGDPGKLGIVVRPLGGLLGKITLEAPIAVRDSGDYGLTSTISDIPRTLNGLPIDIRAIDLTLNGLANGEPFMTNPARCSPATSTLAVTSHGGARAQAHAAFSATDCESVPFAPALELAVDDPRVDSPSAATIGIRLPGDDGGRAQGHLRDTTVTLPEGFGLNPSVADGLVLCTDEQFAAQNDRPVRCPESSDIGDVLFETPVLPPLSGDVFFGTAPDDPYRLLIVAQTGNLRVKIQASVRLDPDTGQITTVFKDLPQFPLIRFALTFRGGDRSVLATPPTCGTYAAATSIVPWNGGGPRTPSAQMTASYDGAGGCDQPSAPMVDATPTTRRARADTDVRVDIARRPRDKPLRTVTTTLPDGLLGRVLSVPACDSGDARRGTCPARSRIGTVRVEFGAGARTQTLDGTLSLAEAGEGGLARLALSIPARIGPIDLGTFALTAPLRLGYRSGRIEVAARLPTAFRGIRLSMRRITLDIDRDGFLFNPSGCAGRTTDLAAESPDGSVATASTPYAVAGCEALPFAGGIALTSADTENRSPGLTPPITVALEPRGSDASLGEVHVAFPVALQPNIDLLRAVCNSAALDAGRCPSSTVVGSASATTPLIPGTLEGPVVLTYPERPEQGPGLGLPSASVVLSGLNGLVRLRLDGHLRLAESRLQATFAGIPDVPLTSFRLALRGGMFVTVGGVCAPDVDDAEGRVLAHNGRGGPFAQPIDFAACRRSPIRRVVLRGLHSLRPVVDARVERAPLGGRLRTVTLKLPDRLTLRRGRRGVRVLADGRPLASRHWVVAKRSIRIRGGLGAGAERIRVLIRGGAVRAQKATRRRARREDLRLPFRIAVRDTRGSATAERVLARDPAWRARP